jgi:hypothetical protein
MYISLNSEIISYVKTFRHYLPPESVESISDPIILISTLHLIFQLNSVTYSLPFPFNSENYFDKSA